MARKMMLSVAAVMLGSGLAFSQASFSIPGANGRFVGKVTAVNAAANAITLVNKAGLSRTFAIPASAAIRAGKRAITLGAVKIGSEAAVKLNAVSAVASVTVLSSRRLKAPVPQN